MHEIQSVPGIPGAFALRVEHLPRRLTSGRPYSPIGDVADGTLLLHADGIGRFLVRGGEVIEYMVEPGADEVAVERFLWGSARSALIHQRGELPLHAACVVRPDGSGAIAICGPSGAGKSSTGAALMQLGWQPLADDLVRVETDEAGTFVWSGPAHMRLCPDACAALAIGTDGLERDHADRNKFLLEVPPLDGRRALHAIVELGGEEANPRLERLQGAGALAVLSRHVVGPRKMRAVSRMQQHFACVSLVAANVPIWRLHGRKNASARILAEHLHAACNER